MPQVLVLCGNKLDEEQKRSVLTKEGLDLATEFQIMFFEVSAKEDLEVNKMIYSGISNLDCFDEFREEYKNLPYDIEYENSISPVDSSRLPPTPKNNTNIKIEPTNEKNTDKESKKKPCKC